MSTKFTKPVLAISLLASLVAMSATANAGATITDKSYWPSEARQSLQNRTGGSQSDRSFAFAYDRTTFRVQPALNTADGGPAWRYQGGPKSQMVRSGGR